MIRALKKLIPERSPLRLGWHFAKAIAAAIRYGFPARKLTIIGVTGTDGKTTTVGMIAHILQEYGIPSGALSTAFFRIHDSIEWNETQKTSPSPFIVQQFLRSLSMKDALMLCLSTPPTVSSKAVRTTRGLQFLRSRIHPWSTSTITGVLNSTEWIRGSCSTCSEREERRF